MYFLAAGRGRAEAAVTEIGDGIYEASMQFARPGAYYLYVGVPSLNLEYGKLPVFTIQANPPPTAQRAAGKAS